MAKRKCLLCGEWIEDNSQSIPYKGKYVHSKCFQISMKTLKQDKDEKLAEKKERNKTTKTKSIAKPKAELKDAVSEEEYAEKKQYYQYLRSLLAIEKEDKLVAKIYAMTDNYIKQYGFTWIGLYQTLTYMHEIIEKDLTGDIVGIIPYYYDQAQEHYKTVQEVEDNNKNIKIDKMYKENTVLIQPKKRKIKQIDIESI